MIPVNGGPPMPKHEQRRGGRWGHPLSSNPLSKSESPAGAWGQVPPWQGPWGTPSSLSPSPMCNLSLSPSQLPTLQGLPQFRGFGVQGAVSPLVCAQVAPNPSVIRAMGRDFFFCLGISPCSLHCPHPGPQPRADVPPGERTPLLQAAKGSGQRRHCPPFLPHP